MKHVSYLFLLFCLSVVLSGCIVTSSPDEDVITISPGDTVYFKVATTPANEKIRWEIDGAEVQEGGKEFIYTHEEKDTSTEHEIIAKTNLIPYKNNKSWIVKIPRLAPVLNDISIKGTGKTSVTLEEVTLSVSGNPAPDISAYIGYPSEIQVNGSTVTNILEGPVDVSSGAYRFEGLSEDPANPGNLKFKIIVVAENDEGVDTKIIEVDLSQESEINPDDYLEMTKEEIGHLIWFKKIADQDLDDFSLLPSVRVEGVPITGNMQLAFNSNRYQIAFGTYFLATEQFHKLPACTEFIQPIYDRFIQKMLQKRVWTYWSITSMGLPPIEPTFWFAYPSERDPVVKRNIMYSGHLAHMMALYEKLYKSSKWTGNSKTVFTGSATAKYEEGETTPFIGHKDYTVDEEEATFSFMWNENEAYHYNLGSLLQCLYDQNVFQKDNCIECEPNLCFAPCNTHQPLAFLLHDEKYDSDFSTANELLVDWYIRTKQFDPIDHEVAHFYLVKQEKNIRHDDLDVANLLSLVSIPVELLNDALGILNLKEHSLSAWTGTFMHAFEPSYIEQHYPHQRDDNVYYYGDGKARLKQDWLGEQYSHAFFACWAAEMGDTELRDKLLAWTVEIYDPIWGEDGSFHYPNGFDWVFNPLPVRTPVSCPITDKVAALGRAIPAGGIFQMHNRPFTGTDEGVPQIVDVDFPNVILKRAIYDDSKDALIVSTVPGALNTYGSTTIKIKYVDASRSWTLSDGFGTTIDYFAATGIPGDYKTIEIQVDLNGEHDFVLRAD